VPRHPKDPRAGRVRRDSQRLHRDLPGGTPGGWNLIGHTPLPPLCDIEREPPNLVSVGDRVMFQDMR
jgi:hypothetical protein